MADGDGPPALKVVHVLSAAPEDWQGESGYIDGGLLRRHVGETGETGFYVCGPPVVMAKVIRALRGMGVPAGRIHSEQFSL